jgi:hypothetical protein
MIQKVVEEWFKRLGGEVGRFLFTYLADVKVIVALESKLNESETPRRQRK